MEIFSGWVLFYVTQKPQESIKDRQWVRRTSGDKKINRKNACSAVVLFRMFGIESAGNGA